MSDPELLIHLQDSLRDVEAEMDAVWQREPGPAYQRTALGFRQSHRWRELNRERVELRQRISKFLARAS